jgi:small conductance mechanosensitive channel
MTRDFGYAVLDLSVGLNETPERIGEILHKIAEEMREDIQWRTAMTGPLEVMGVEKFLPDAWVMRARVRTTPGQRWAVGRELNQRIKARFDEQGIESPMTSWRALGKPTPGKPVELSE